MKIEVCLKVLINFPTDIINNSLKYMFIEFSQLVWKQLEVTFHYALGAQHSIPFSPAAPPPHKPRQKYSENLSIH